MKSITRWLAALAVLCQPFMFTSCHDDDLANGIIDEGGDSEESVVPTEDKIETYLDGDIALIGNKFDEATSYILSRVRGQKINLSLGSSSVPTTARALLIDDENMMNLTADDIDRLIVPAYKQGTIICMHKPSDWKAAGVQMALWQAEHGTYGVDVAENALASAAKSHKTRATDDGTSYEDSSSDFIAIKPGGMDFSMADIYTPNTTSQAVMQITTQEDDGEIMTKDSIVTVPSEEPTDYEYGRFAEEAVKWMNETEEEAKSKAMRAVLSTRNEGDNINVSQVCNSQRTVSCTFWNRHGNPNGDGAFVKQDYNRNVPLKIRVYTSSAYNFDLDEDYYHVVMEEEFDASKLYHGRFEMKEKDMRIAGYTWQGMEVQARWNNSDYAVRDEWNIQPQGRAQPVVTETVNGWEIGANVSLGKDGVSGTLSGKLTYKEGVTSTESDVELTNTRQDDWMVWSYRMGNQVSFTGSKGKVNGPNVPTNATSRSLSSRRQSWDWVIKGTRRRADNPFTFDFKVQEMTGQVAWADIYPLMTQKRSEVFTADMTDAATQFSIPLPSPERYRHVYTFTTDDIEDPAEFTALMSSLQSVSSNFRSLYGKLIREDSKDNPLGRTAVSYEALHRMVGQEWYDLANDLQGKKIGVKNTYKFYVKDEEGSKLNMVSLDKGTYKQMGTYLVIAPDGIRIEQDDNSTGVFDSGDIFTYRVNGYDLTFQVHRNGKDCRLIGVPENYTGALVIPATVYELNVIEMDRDVTKDLGGVTSLTIPSTYTHIGPEFSELNFRELIVKNGVRTFYGGAFYGCAKLTTITLPPTFYRLGTCPFYRCPAIRTINCEGTVPPTLGEGVPGDAVFSPTVYENATVYVPKGCVSVYQRTYPWSSFKKIVEAGTSLNK